MVPSGFFAEEFFNKYHGQRPVSPITSYVEGKMYSQTFHDFELEPLISEEGSDYSVDGLIEANSKYHEETEKHIGSFSALESKTSEMVDGYFPDSRRPILITIVHTGEDSETEKQIFMPELENTTVIKYKIKTEKPIKIRHTPIINSRHFYETSSMDSFSIKQDINKNEVNIYPSNIDRLIKILIKDSKYKKNEYWEEKNYSIDKDRNDSFIDYNLKIGTFEKIIKKSDEYYLVCSIEDKKHENYDKIYKTEINKKKQLLLKAGLTDSFKKLILSSDNFIVKKGDGNTVIAGYHWFSDWGRDTLISLPGLTLVTSRFNIAKQILIELAKYCKNGLIPNVFMDKKSDASYNSVDTSLWFIDRVFQYLKYTNDVDFLIKIWPTLTDIIEYYKSGTDYNIFMDKDFLISHDPGLTWMDVKLGDFYPTPRSNKAVEIQALWYNALIIMSILSKKLGETDNYFYLSEKMKDSFNFSYDKQYDVIDKRDLSIRPNQIFLSSLDFNLINLELQSKIVSTVEKELVTIFGLRTLSMSDVNFKGQYISNYNRDLSYHNGIVWPWLLGQYIKSFVKITLSEVSLTARRTRPSSTITRVSRFRAQTLNRVPSTATVPSEVCTTN